MNRDACTGVQGPDRTLARPPGTPRACTPPIITESNCARIQRTGGRCSTQQQFRCPSWAAPAGRSCEPRPPPCGCPPAHAPAPSPPRRLRARRVSAAGQALAGSPKQIGSTAAAAWSAGPHCGVWHHAKGAAADDGHNARGRADSPASSAMRACSGVTTSIITPPLSICASPTCAASGTDGVERGGDTRHAMCACK